MALRALLLAVSILLASSFSAAGGYEAAGDDDDGAAGFFLGHSSLIACAAAAPHASGDADDGGAAFQAGLAPLLAALPSAAAAAAAGFATLRSATTGARAFGLCFSGDPAPAGGSCLECLSAAVEAEAEGCGNDTRRAGVWRDGCLLAYAAAAADDDDRGGFQFLAGDARPYFDRLDRALADLARAQGETKGQSIWRMALSVLFYALAAVGAVFIVLLLLGAAAGIMVAETFVRHSSAGHAAAGAGQGGEGITAFVAATNGGSPIWSVAAQVRVY
ncbi:hypothetical protein EJB05_36052, partial [Eragrostis curvula]